jgi:hypothetical protein
MRFLPQQSNPQKFCLLHNQPQYQLKTKKFRKSQAGLPGLPAGTTKGKVLLKKWFVL